MAGYNGYSMSNNAVSAYECGEKPWSRWTKTEILEEVDGLISDGFTLPVDRKALGKVPAKCGSVEEYNLQAAELDANAYAAIVMERDFGLKALFQGLPEAVRKAIRRRASEIKASSGC